MVVSDKSEPYPRGLRRALWLVLPVWVVLAVELIGGWRFDKDMYSSRYAFDLRGLRWVVIYATLIAVVVSPPLVISALLVARRNRFRIPEAKTIVFWRSPVADAFTSGQHV